jgi:hypothetical protein
MVSIEGEKRDGRVMMSVVLHLMMLVFDIRELSKTVSEAMQAAYDDDEIVGWKMSASILSV